MKVSAQFSQPKKTSSCRMSVLGEKLASLSSSERSKDRGNNEKKVKQEGEESISAQHKSERTLDELDDDARQSVERAQQYLKAEGPLAKVEHLVKNSSDDNRKLYQQLQAGKLFIGEYHAQLALDNIYLADVKEKRIAELGELVDEEKKLDARLDYLFLECQRLSDDNQRIVQDGKSKDQELADLYSQLELQNTKFKSLQKGVRSFQHDQAYGVQSLFKASEQKRVSKQKLIRQHERIWELQDTIEGLKEDITMMTAMIKRGRKLDPLDNTTDAENEKLQQQRKRKEVAEKSENNLSNNSCSREDCAVLRQQLKEVLQRIQVLSKKQQQLQAQQATASSSSLALDSSRASHAGNSVVSKSFGPSPGSRGARRKSVTTFIL